MIAMLAALIAATTTARAQSNTFHVTYGGSADDMSQGGIVRTADGNLIMVGYGRSVPSQREGVLVVKLDPCGDTIWTRVYDFGIGEIGRRIRMLPDQGFVIVGSFRPAGIDGRDAFLMRIDDNGSVVWLNRYGNTAPGIIDEGHDVCVDAGGSIYAAGTTASSGAGLIDGWVWKVDVAGVLQWSRTYGGVADDMLYGIDLAGDSIIAVGRTFSFNASGYGWTLGIDPGSGGHRWSHWEDDIDELRSVRIDPVGGSYVSVGRRALSAVATEALLATGSRIGAVRIEPALAGRLELNEAQFTQTGIHAVGTWTPDASPSQVYLTRVSPSSGSVSLSRHFGGSAGEEGFSLCEAYDRDRDGTPELAISGSTGSFGGGGYDAYVIGVQASGSSGCHEGEVPYAVKIDPMVSMSTAPVVTSYVTGFPYVPVVEPRIPVTVVCRSCVRGPAGLPGGGIGLGDMMRGGTGRR